jgi:transcriptional regulator of acetoin/glycerol metabolism
MTVSISEEMDMKDAREALELKMIVDALEQTGGNISAAARDLGVQRKTLHRKIELLGIDMQEFGKNREALTREAIVAALEKVQGSISAAARELGVPRTTLYRNMEMFGVDPDGFRRG